MRGIKEDVIEPRSFSDIDLQDSFFDSLRKSYTGFDDWYMRKINSDEEAFVSYDDFGHLVGFMFLKAEFDYDATIIPPMSGPRMKIGTFKIEPDHHTGLGRRFLAIALRLFAKSGVPYVYVTMFDGEGTQSLGILFQQYGFYLHGVKGDSELVYRKDRPTVLSGDPYRDYPFFDIKTRITWMLAIRPEYHSRMFGDIELQSEKGLPIVDEKATNTIEKAYLSASWDAPFAHVGDNVIIYRTGDGRGPARYRAVISSICTIAEVKNLAEFQSSEQFIQYIRGRSVFSREELEGFWKSRKYPFIITLLFNAPFERYPTRGDLLDNGLIDENDRIVFNRISDQTAVEQMLEMGCVSEGYVVD